MGAVLGRTHLPRGRSHLRMPGPLSRLCARQHRSPSRRLSPVWHAGHAASPTLASAQMHRGNRANHCTLGWSPPSWRSGPDMRVCPFPRCGGSVGVEGAVVIRAPGERVLQGVNRGLRSCYDFLPGELKGPDSEAQRKPLPWEQRREISSMLSISIVGRERNASPVEGLVSTSRGSKVIPAQGFVSQLPGPESPLKMASKDRR